ncbi:hypothetical protein [Longimicrobium sp.]|uniref:hypothetical protein n=1 Tax=Longimicrobium sp. TaxID=2029185 RepID=UPI002E3365DE|nr:hypothetical protein [Longimicrobium sp.]HEX6042259.1 hypothetical protein [Longimicrobium sp.]
MPAGSTWLNRDKPRPFVLTTAYTPGRLATLVYGSSQETEMRHGAAFIAVEPVPAGLRRNRLRSTTYFYPGTLLPVRYPLLPPHAGFLGGALDELRRMLRRALGIGQGSCLAPGADSNSRRGRVVILQPWMERDLRTSLAVLLTESRYSAEANYQIILPIYPAARSPLDGDDIRISLGEWLTVAPALEEGALLPIPAVHSVWQAHAIARETEHVMDEESLARIDRALCDYFSLPDPPPGG